MKVFEVFYYNLNQIRFKQNKEYLDALLKEFGFEYSNISFIFKYDPTGSACDRTIRKFSELKEYVRYHVESEYDPCSMPTYSFLSVNHNQDGTLTWNMKKEHHHAFSELLKKIPHSVNFAFMGVVLDKADWYKNKFPNDAFINGMNKCIVTDQSFYRYLSNSVRFFKEYDYGNKKNYIEVMIDRTPDGETLREYPERFEELVNKLGKPYDKYLRCGFDDNERRVLEAARDRINEWKKQHDYSHHFDNFKNREMSIADSVTPVSGYSPKSVLNKVARKNGYKYIRCVNGCYIYKKTNENNHSFVVKFMFRPFSLYVDASVSAEGYNFNHWIYSDKEISAKDADILCNYAQSAFKAASEIEKDTSDLLYTLYGKTPDWFM